MIITIAFICFWLPWVLFTSIIIGRTLVPELPKLQPSSKDPFYIEAMAELDELDREMGLVPEEQVLVPRKPKPFPIKRAPRHPSEPKQPSRLRSDLIASITSGVQPVAGCSSTYRELYGTTSRYRDSYCRCVDCVRAHHEYQIRSAYSIPFPGPAKAYREGVSYDHDLPRGILTVDHDMPDEQVAELRAIWDRCAGTGRIVVLPSNLTIERI